jgi:hypothetical protein
VEAAVPDFPGKEIKRRGRAGRFLDREKLSDDGDRPARRRVRPAVDRIRQDRHYWGYMLASIDSGSVHHQVM